MSPHSPNSLKIGNSEFISEINNEVLKSRLANDKQFPLTPYAVIACTNLRFLESATQQ